MAAPQGGRLRREWCRIALAVMMATLAGAAPSQAQRAVGSQRPSRQPPGQVATICSNDAGWCPLLEGVIAAGAPCQCFLPGQGYVGGVGRYFNYAMYPDRPVSPYFNPHWTDAPPAPPTLR